MKTNDEIWKNNASGWKSFESGMFSLYSLLQKPFSFLNPCSSNTLNDEYIFQTSISVNNPFISIWNECSVSKTHVETMLFYHVGKFQRNGSNPPRNKAVLQRNEAKIQGHNTTLCFNKPLLNSNAENLQCYRSSLKNDKAGLFCNGTSVINVAAYLQSNASPLQNDNANLLCNRSSLMNNAARLLNVFLSLNSSCASLRRLIDGLFSFKINCNPKNKTLLKNVFFNF